MDAGEPPQIVIESLEPCQHADRVSSSLRRELSAARAPRKSWVLRFRVDPHSGRSVVAEGDITDDAGMPIARRTLLGTKGDCEGLAVGIGVWASLAFDAELARDRASAASMPADDAGAPSSPASSPSAPNEPSKTDAGPRAAVAASEDELSSSDPSTAIEKPAAEGEHGQDTRRDESRTLEFGAGAFLMTGSGGSALAGVSPFVVIEVGHGVFLRPSLAIGWSAPVAAVADLHETWTTARFDTCLRLAGLYMQQRGLQLDTCGGADVGFTHHEAGGQGPGVAASDVTNPYMSVGPSLALRGELGGDFAVAVRLMGGVNVIQEGYIDSTGGWVAPSWVTARVEVALSWSLR